MTLFAVIVIDGPHHSALNHPRAYLLGTTVRLEVHGDLLGLHLMTFVETQQRETRA